MLKDIPLSASFHQKADKAYLDFLVGIFISSLRHKPDASAYESRLWFLQEIALLIQVIWPNLTKIQYQNIINSIIDMASTKEVKKRFLIYPTQTEQ